MLAIRFRNDYTSQVEACHEDVRQQAKVYKLGEYIIKKYSDISVATLGAELSALSLQHIKGVIPVNLIRINVHIDRISLKLIMTRGKSLKKCGHSHALEMFPILSQIEGCGITHGDIAYSHSSKNFVCVDGTLNIIDFGLITGPHNSDTRKQSYSAVKIEGLNIPKNDATELALYSTGITMACMYNPSLNVSCQMPISTKKSVPAEHRETFLRLVDRSRSDKFNSFREITCMDENKPIVELEEFTCTDEVRRLILNYYNVLIRDSAKDQADALVKSRMNALLLGIVSQLSYAQFQSYIDLIEEEEEYTEMTVEIINLLRGRWSTFETHLTDRQLTETLYRLVTIGTFSVSTNNLQWDSFNVELAEILHMYPPIQEGRILVCVGTNITSVNIDVYI